MVTVLVCSKDAVKMTTICRRRGLLGTWNVLFWGKGRSITQSAPSLRRSSCSLVVSKKHYYLNIKGWDWLEERIKQKLHAVNVVIGQLSYDLFSLAQHNVYGSFINSNSLHASQSRQYSALHWRHLQNCKTASITTCLLKWHVSCVFDNSANLMMMLPRDSRYNLALSLLKSDNCRQSYTASGPHMPMCPP